MSATPQNPEQDGNHLQDELDGPTVESEEIVAARSLMCQVRTICESSLLHRGGSGPFPLPGRFTLDEFQALSDLEDGFWGMRWLHDDLSDTKDIGTISLSGDISKEHAVMRSFVRDCIYQGLLPFLKHEHAPQQINQAKDTSLVVEGTSMCIFVSEGPADRRWNPTPTSICQSQPDGFIRPGYMTALAHDEKGLAVEVAFMNESVETLRESIVRWTSGVGNRATLAVGLKCSLDKDGDDHEFTLIVRDTTSRSPSTAVFQYPFGRGSGIIEQQVLDETSPATECPISAKDGYNVVAGVDGKLLLDLPLGLALYDGVDPASEYFRDQVPIHPAYVEHLKAVKWRIDLGNWRYDLRQLITYMKREPGSWQHHRNSIMLSGL